jgi:hypothetical protein
LEGEMELVTHEGSLPDVIVDPLPGEGAVVDDLADEAVAHLNALHVRAGLEAARETGRFILDTFFAGSLEAFEARGLAHATFRSLAERLDLRVSYVYLWRAVRVMAQMDRLPPEVCEALPYTHHTLLLPLREDRKEELARRAVAESWSKRRLEVEIDGLREPQEGPRRGRPALPPVVKGLRKVSRVLEELEGLDVEAGLEGYEEEDLVALLNELEQREALLAAARQAVRRRLET